MSDYSLCRVLVKDAWSEQARGEAVTVLRARGTDCRPYIPLIAQQDANAMALIGIGAAVATQPPAYVAPPPVICTPVSGSVVCR